MKYYVFKASGVLWILFSIILTARLTINFFLGNLISVMQLGLFSSATGLAYLIELMIIIMIVIMIFPIGLIILDYANKIPKKGTENPFKTDDESDWWFCSKCNFENTPSAYECSNCLTKRPKTSSFK